MPSKPRLASVDAIPLQVRLLELGPIALRQVQHTGEESLFNSLFEHYYYLGYIQPVDEHLKYLTYVRDRPLAGFA